jgi:hypothetical protein
MMKRIILILILTIKTMSANCDVIFFPYQYTLLCYSAELIYSHENIKKSKNTTNFWAGTGVVGSFLYLDMPTYGLELAIEKRHYFKPDQFKHFFISAYLGTAYMTNFNDISHLGLVPGLKINYKAQLTQKIILEPYVSLSLPITYDLQDTFGYVPFPVLTIGARFGLSNLKNKTRPKIPT